MGDCGLKWGKMGGFGAASLSHKLNYVCPICCHRMLTCTTQNLHSRM